MTARLRVLMTADAVGGVWTYAVTLARALADHATINLLTLGPPPSLAQRAQALAIGNVILTETSCALEWQDPAGDNVARARAALREAAEAFAPDIVHVNGYREAAYDWPAPVVAVAHSCVDTWAEACGRRDDFSDARWATYRQGVARGLGAANAWVAPSLSFRTQMQAQHRLDRPGQVIWNGVAPRAAHAAKQPTILAAGRLWDAAKNIEALAAIAPALPWPVTVAGAGGSGSGCVDWLGDLPHDALLDAMDRATIFVSPARYEPFGLGVLEAACAGCALVLSDIPTFRELWDGAAAFVDPHNRAALKAALDALCHDDIRRARLQQAAQLRARRYGAARMAGGYRALYRALLPRAADRLERSA